MLVVMGLHWTARRGAFGAAAGAVEAKPVRSWVRLIFYGIYLIWGGSFIVLALTGFAATLGWGGPMSGYLLMLHCTAAPVFCAATAALALIWAERSRLRPEDWKPASCEIGWGNIFFWLMLLATIPLILSMVVSMLPIFGTEGQEFLYHLHRWSALALLLCGGYMIFLKTAFRPGSTAA
ncbi:MAG: hypothetical protein JW810_14275 [Sedimentisphaerales bacterium]|nr:hypothetical protein [Sedimentisphaerales bacterium]